MGRDIHVFGEILIDNQWKSVGLVGWDLKKGKMVLQQFDLGRNQEVFDYLADLDDDYPTDVSPEIKNIVLNRDGGYHSLNCLYLEYVQSNYMLKQFFDTVIDYMLYQIRRFNATNGRIIFDFDA